MASHIWNHLITLSLLKLIQLEDMAEYVSLFLPARLRLCFFCEMNRGLDFGASLYFFAVQWNPWPGSFKDSVWIQVLVFQWFNGIPFSFFIFVFTCLVPQLFFIEFDGCSCNIFAKVGSLFGSFYEFLVTVSCLIGAVIEHLMSTKGLKLLGTRSSYMISYKVPKILKDSTVRFISLRRWSIRT